MSYLLKVFCVFFIALQSFARAFTIAEVIFKAHFEFSLCDIGRSELEVAGSERYIVLYQVHQFAYSSYTRKRPQVFRAVFYNLACEKHSGERLILYNNVRIGLIVLELNIEARL